MQIPDDIASRMIEAGGNLSRRALEAFARHRPLNHPVPDRQRVGWIRL
jgi:hypothetical protein